MRRAGRPPLPEAPRLLEERGGGPSALVPALLEIQRRRRFLPPEELEAARAAAGVSAADLAGILSFYPALRTRPAGLHLVRVCVGTACHLAGASLVHDEIARQIGLRDGADTDDQGLFTVEKVACLGCCTMAPAVQADGRVFGPVAAAGIPDLLHDVLSADGGPGPPPLPAAAPGGAEARICLCSGCLSAGAAAVEAELVRAVRNRGLGASVRRVSCTGETWRAPLVSISLPDGTVFRYGKTSPGEAGDLLSRHLSPRGAPAKARAAVHRLVDRLLDGDGRAAAASRAPLRPGPDPHGGDGQVRIATEGAGESAPLDLDDYLSRGGFSALRRALFDLSPERVVALVAESGLRGRGGGGYPAGPKWERVLVAPGGPKHVVGNGDEGDPGAFMDRMILESFPFRVIEGMAIAGRAVGARSGYLYVRGEYPLAVAAIREAIALCRARGFLGPDLMGSGAAFDLSVVEGAGAFVCGEETALLAALEGRRGHPRPRPPYPSESGYLGRPTLVNNVETFACVPWIVRHGPAAFAALGTPSSRGTKAFALAGKVARSGLVEVPMGTTLRRLVEEVGGGPPPGARVKGVQIGGPLGGIVPASALDTPVDFEALAGAGALMGSGGVVVLDDRDCVADLSRYFMDFARRESCGRCSLCRIGTERMAELLGEICDGRGKRAHLARLEALAKAVSAGSLCGLGRMAPRPLLSSLAHFREEYEAHLSGRCPAGRCKPLIRYVVTEACIGCAICARRCPAAAIAPAPHERHVVDDALCIRCGLCRQVCPAAAVEVR